MTRAAACIYVGKAKSIRKRVARHFSNPTPTARATLPALIDPIESARRRHRGRGAAHRAELHQAVQAALQHPAARRQVLPLHRDQPRRGLPARLLHPRAPPARARVLRSLLERQARARHARPARQDLPVPLLRGPGAGPALAARRAWTTTSSAARRPASATSSKEEYRRGDRRRDRLPLAAATGRSSATSSERMPAAPASRTSSRPRSSATACTPCARCSSASGWPTSRWGRSTRSRSPSRAPKPTRRSSRSATACCPTASRSTSRTRARRAPREVAEEFLLQYYASAIAIPPLIVRAGHLADGSELGPRPRPSPSAAAGRSRCAPPSAATKRRILELAERNARLALDQEKLKAERRRQRRVEALDGLQRALGLDALPMRIECFDISNLGGTHTTASMVVFEGGAPKKSDYRRFTIRERRRRRRLRGDGRGARAPLRAVGDAARTARRTTPSATRRSRALPNLVVIDGGKGQLAAGLEPLQGFRERGVAVISLAKRIEEVFLPGRATPLVLDARHARAAAAPARARRGPPLRDHPPPACAATGR